VPHGEHGDGATNVTWIAPEFDDRGGAGQKLERARAIIAKGLSVREAVVRLKVGKTALYAALREPQ
jgi:precorrin-4 methylase